jgi:hypothetical protein
VYQVNAAAAAADNDEDDNDNDDDDDDDDDDNNKKQQQKQQQWHSHITSLEEHCHNSKYTAFQERGKTTGWGDAIPSKERHFSPLTAILENRRVMLFH